MSKVLPITTARHRAQVVVNLQSPILLAYYLFVFSLPFQTASAALSRFGTASKLIGYAFVVLTILKPKLCYRRPGAALYCFAFYLVTVACSWLLGDSASESFDVVSFLTLVQLLVLFWVSSNLFKYDSRIIWRALLSFSIACLFLAIAMVFGLAGQTVFDDRLTALDANPNAIGEVLMLGLLALAGLAYGQQQSSRRVRLFFWLVSAFLFVSIIRTGSRGAIAALFLGLLTLLLKRASFRVRMKVAAVVILSGIFIAVVSNSIESVAERWRETFVEGDTAGRDEIYALAWQMFLEKPILGWGPDHQKELGSRLGLPTRDFHNIYLHVLTQVGIAGAIPFFLGMALCFRSAWKARKNAQGILPLAMLISLSAMSFTGTTMTEKWLWIVMAYATAAGAYPAVAVQGEPRAVGISRLPAGKGFSVPKSREYQSLSAGRFATISRRLK